MRRTFQLFFVFGLIKYALSQFLTIGGNNKTLKSSCDPSTKSALVEHFFNIIFTEFHNTPPVCVCVQMCPEQPTYCYPNGCLKRAEKNKKVDVPLPVTRLSENTKPIFFIDEKNDFMNDFLAKNYIDDSKSLSSPAPEKPESPTQVNMRPDPFKDRYKILFKYKKMPKVEFKYNLGEQVKNMRSDTVDVSKTRWPMNKMDRRLVSQRMIHNEHAKKNTPNPRYFMSIFPEKDANYPPKYFKRELPNNASSEDDRVDIKAIYVVGKSESESNAFSLEKLIDSLIDSVDNNTTTTPDIDTQIETTAKETNFETQHELNKTATKEDTSKFLMNNVTTNVISINYTNENVDKNKYSDDDINNKSNTASEMIASLSKRIDKQNNTSLEMMRRITGDFEFDSINTTEKLIETTTNGNTKVITTESMTLPIDYETKTTKKIRQRIVRRLQNSKNN